MLSCIQSLELICRVSKEGISTILCSKVDCEINNVTCFEIVHASPCRSIALSLSDCDKEASALLGHSRGSFNLEAVEKKEMKIRDLEMRSIFSPLDDTLSMSMLQLKKRLLPAADPKPHWFWKAIVGRKVSLRDLNRDAFQYFMRCKVLHWFKGDGIL